MDASRVRTCGSSSTGTTDKAIATYRRSAYGTGVLEPEDQPLVSSGSWVSHRSLDRLTTRATPVSGRMFDGGRNDLIIPTDSARAVSTQTAELSGCSHSRYLLAPRRPLAAAPDEEVVLRRGRGYSSRAKYVYSWSPCS